MNINKTIRTTAKYVFNFPFKGMKGKPRKLAYLTAMRVIDRLLGQNCYDWQTNGEEYFLQCLACLMPSGNVLDVGANHGDWARIALSVSPKWYVYCFEPNPTTFAALQSAGLPPGRSRLHEFGFSDRNEHGEIINYRVRDKDRDFVSSPMSSVYYRHSVMMSEPLSVESKVPISLRTIDSFCRSQEISEITLLKIDVEGHEFRVLRGANELLATARIDAIQFEYDACYIDSRTFLLDVWTFLQEQHGYQIYKIAPEGLIEIRKYHPGLENFRFSNFVALSATCKWPRQQICMVL